VGGDRKATEVDGAKQARLPPVYPSYYPTTYLHLHAKRNKRNIKREEFPHYLDIFTDELLMGKSGLEV